MNGAFDSVISADAETRLGLFTDTAQALGTTARNVEKDFWVCWTLDALFNGMPARNTERVRDNRAGQDCR
jgi:hypothetical protein